MVDFFTVNPLVGAKQESFLVWSQCLEIINSGSHQSSEGFTRIVELRYKINGMRRPSTFREFKDLPSDMLGVNPARNVSSWTSDELEMIASYIDGFMSRNDLNKKLGRSIPSISNKISRESKVRMESEQQKDV